MQFNQAEQSRVGHGGFRGPDAAPIESAATASSEDGARAEAIGLVNHAVDAHDVLPEAVAGRARRYNFSTDAGHRFERGVDPEQTVEHIERITALIVQICGTADTRIGPIDDQTTRLPERRPVALRVDRAAKVIGMPVTQAQCAQVFERLGLAFESTPGVLTVTPPSWRFDLQIEEDLIEEVIRVLGYHRLSDTPPVAPVRAQVRVEARRGAHAVRHALAALTAQAASESLAKGLSLAFRSGAVTGTVGSALVPLLERAGHTVRRASSRPAHEQVQVLYSSVLHGEAGKL